MTSPEQFNPIGENAGRQGETKEQKPDFDNKTAGNKEKHFVRKKKSPTEILEEDKEPLFEAGLVKVRGGEYKDFRKEKFTVASDLYPEFKAEHIGDKPYSKIHTHPRLERGTKVEDPSILVDPGYSEIVKYDNEDVEMMRADVSPSLPSTEDLINVLTDKNIRSSIIGQRDPITGKVAGYFIIKRMKKTPLIPPMPEGEATDEQWSQWYKTPEVAEAFIFLESPDYSPSREQGYPLTPEQIAEKGEALRKFADKYNLKIRMVPNKGYEYKNGLGFLKK